MKYETNEVEDVAIDAFKKKHRHWEGLESRISFQATGIGMIVRVHCSICKRVLNVTDYESW